MNTLLQSLVFPHSFSPAGSEPLYFRGAGFSVGPGGAALRAGGRLDLSAYFNLFHEERWRKYTVIGEIVLRLKFRGDLNVRVLRDRIVFLDRTLSAPTERQEELVLGAGTGVLSVQVQALKESHLYGGGFWAETSKRPEAQVSIIICTFHRERYLLPNLETLKEHLPEGWDVIVVDNGRSLPEGLAERFGPRFRFLPNPNAGGSGGFTRGILQALSDGDKSAALLMDDDVVLEPAALERTASFWSLLKQEYRGHFLAGAMLRLDTPCVQHEATAFWNGIRVHPCGHNLNLARYGDLRKSLRESKGKNQYAAWWYCLIPLSPDLESDLPRPFFVNGDDIEYSLRRARGVLNLNGVAVWHEPFDKKVNPVKQYYLTCRNGLVINACHGYSLFRSLLLVYLRLVRLIVRGDRTGMKLVRMGLEDFLTGPMHFEEIDTGRILASRSESDLGLRNKASRNSSLANKSTLARYASIRLEYEKALPDREFWERYLSKMEREAVNAR